MSEETARKALDDEGRIITRALHGRSSASAYGMTVFPKESRTRLYLNFRSPTSPASVFSRLSCTPHPSGRSRHGLASNLSRAIDIASAMIEWPKDMHLDSNASKPMPSSHATSKKKMRAGTTPPPSALLYHSFLRGSPSLP